MVDIHAHACAEEKHLKGYTSIYGQQWLPLGQGSEMEARTMENFRFLLYTGLQFGMLLNIIFKNI